MPTVIALFIERGMDFVKDAAKGENAIMVYKTPEMNTIAKPSCHEKPRARTMVYEKIYFHPFRE